MHKYTTSQTQIQINLITQMVYITAHKYTTSQTQIQINLITQMVCITMHKYTISQTQIRIGSCNIPSFQSLACAEPTWEPLGNE